MEVETPEYLEKRMQRSLCSQQTLTWNLFSRSPFSPMTPPPLQLCTHTYWSRLTGRLQNRWEKGRGHSAEANPCYYLLPSLSFVSLLHSWICFFLGTGRVMRKHVSTETRRVRGKGPALLLPALWLLGQGMDIWLCISSSVKWVYISFLSMLVCPTPFLSSN